MSDAIRIRQVKRASDGTIEVKWEARTPAGSLAKKQDRGGATITQQFADAMNALVVPALRSVVSESESERLGANAMLVCLTIKEEDGAQTAMVYQTQVAVALDGETEQSGHIKTAKLRDAWRINNNGQYLRSTDCVADDSFLAAAEELVEQAEAHVKSLPVNAGVDTIHQ